jgi:DNA-binding NtrC family response regulator
MSNKVQILIVDDESVVRHAFERILSSDRCDVTAVASGPEALQAMAFQSFDVVLLDLRMPGMDGLTVLRTIKQNWPESKVIVITGYAALQTAKDSVALGAFDYLAKPVGPQDVIRVTRDALVHKGWALRRDRPAASHTVQ